MSYGLISFVYTSLYKFPHPVKTGRSLLAPIFKRAKRTLVEGAWYGYAASRVFLLHGDLAGGPIQLHPTSSSTSTRSRVQRVILLLRPRLFCIIVTSQASLSCRDVVVLALANYNDIYSVAPIGGRTPLAIAGVYLESRFFFRASLSWYMRASADLMARS